VIWFRRLLHRPHAAAWLLAATLLMKLMVPAGFMPVAHHGSMTLLPCSGFGPQTMATSMSMGAGHGGHGEHGQQNPDHHSEQKTPCDFSVLAGPALSADEPVALAEPVQFVALQAPLPPARISREERAHLRPPSRGPPTI
jgi:hypothetical protein